MKFFYTSLILFSLLLYNCGENEEINTDTTDPVNEMYEDLSTEDRVFKAVESLPEYKDAAMHISALTNGEQSISIIMEEPNEFHSDYYLKVGYNQETWFEPYFHFFVNPETFIVTIEDVIEGDIIPIETWRERQKSR